MEQKLILFYNKIDTEYWYFRPEDFPPGYSMTYDRRLLDRADAVVFYLPVLRVPQDIVKREGQLWIAWTTECEKHYPQYRDAGMVGLFDLWMGYRQDYDLFTPYIYPRYRNYLRRIDGLQKKTEGVNMFVSSGFNLSHRLEYLMNLMQYIHIDSYGRMFKNRVIEKDYGPITKKETVAGYRFTIAFENSIDTDYVTEKFYEPLLMGSVPVYLGAPNIETFAPGDHCFINTADFASPRQLADYLRHLEAHPDEYRAYFDWKKQPYRESFDRLLKMVETPLIDRFIAMIESKSSKNTGQ